MKVLIKVFSFVSVFLAIVMFCVVEFNVFSRYFANYSLAWADEVARYCFVWIVFMGATIAHMEGRHPSVAFFISKIKQKRLKMVIFTSIESIICIFAFIMGFSGLKVVLVISNVSPALYLPMRFVYGIVPVASFALVFVCLHRIFKAECVDNACRDVCGY